MAIDVGNGFGERANNQRAADAAALAAIDALEAGMSTDQVIETAEKWAGANGYVDGIDGAKVTVNIPPSDGPYAGNSEYVEVIIATVLPLPLVPATWTVGMPRCGLPSRSASNPMRSRWNAAWFGLCVERSKSARLITRSRAASYSSEGSVVSSDAESAGVKSGMDCC